MYMRTQILMLAGALSASLLGCGAGPDEASELVGEVQQDLDTNYPALAANCNACVGAGPYVDLNGGATLKFPNVNGGSGGAAKLRFSLTSPSGVRTMGVFVNGTKVGTVSSTTLRPTLAEGPSAGISATLNAGSANLVELRDTEGAAEPDVAYLKVTTGTASTVQVAASAGIGGTISPSGSVAVTQGGSKAFTFAPDPDMLVKRVCYPSPSSCFAHSSNTWTLPNAQSGQSVSVEFEYEPGAVCGDGVCNNLETSESCQNDCNPSLDNGHMERGFFLNAVAKPASQASGGEYIDGNQGAVIGYQATALGGWYKLSFRVQSPSGLRKMGVFVNNIKVGVVSSSAPYWNWETVSVNAKLLPGTSSIELRDSEGTTELDVDYFEFTNNVFVGNDATFTTGWSTQNGQQIFTEIVEFQRGSYLSLQPDGSWIIDIFAHTESSRDKYQSSVSSLGLYVRDCVTGAWTNATSTMYSPREPLLSPGEGDSTYGVMYFPANATFRDRFITLDSDFSCPGASPQTVDVTPTGETRPHTVLSAGFQHYALVVKHY